MRRRPHIATSPGRPPSTRPSSRSNSAARSTKFMGIIIRPRIMQSNIKFFSADGTVGRYKGKPACGLPRGAGATACVLPYSTVKGQSPTGRPLRSLHHDRRGSRRRRRIVPFSHSVTARERSDKAVIARRPKGNGAISPYCPLKQDRHGPSGPRDDSMGARGAGAPACGLFPTLWRRRPRLLECGNPAAAVF